MQILLLTLTVNLANKLNVLNPELEYCGIVVDDVVLAENVLKERGLSKQKSCLN